jgi:hypothetical protein
MMPQEGLSAGKRARDIMALLYSSTNSKRALEALLQEMPPEGTPLATALGGNP